MTTAFQRRVYDIVKKIPKGETKTYKQVAYMIGQPAAYRAVGNALNKNRYADVPCHRVIRSDGSVGGFAFGSAKKEKILRQERAIK